jgi:hypothetical protein
MMTLAAGLFATAVVAEVTSGNVVGYQTITVTNGYNMLACNFDGVAGAEGMTFDQLIPGTTPGLTKGAGVSFADNIMVFNPLTKGYVTYFLWYSTKAAQSANNNKWVLSQTVPAAERLNSGDPFWFNSRNTNQTVQIPATFLGQVPTESAKSFSITNGYNMLSCLFAADWDPNILGTNFWAGAPAKKGAGVSFADNIMVFNPTTKGYVTYFLWYSTKAAQSANNYKWVLSQTVVAPTNFVKTGAGVWYNYRETNNVAGFTIPVDRPYTLE